MTNTTNNDPQRLTVGAQAVAAMDKGQDPVSVIDQQRAMQTDYLKNLLECAQTFRKSHPNTDFFIVVLTKREKLLQNVFRNYFTARFTCPVPNYDQAVYRFDNAKEDIEFIWVVPNKETCILYKNNALSIHPEERQLLTFVLAFASGDLYNYCRYLNKEIETKPNISLY